MSKIQMRGLGFSTKLQNADVRTQGTKHREGEEFEYNNNFLIE